MGERVLLSHKYVQSTERKKSKKTAFQFRLKDNRMPASRGDRSPYRRAAAPPGVHTSSLLCFLTGLAACPLQLSDTLSQGSNTISLTVVSDWSLTHLLTAISSGEKPIFRFFMSSTLSCSVEHGKR